ncbi:MAG: hypothetical protein Q8M16_10905 [Pirellulaceae bacterium]|nr:hypothetical protein [Pirellulaceae bacterium]
MREKAGRIRSHSLQILLGSLMIAVFAMSEVHAAGAPQSRGAAQPRVSQPGTNSSQMGRRSTLPPRRGSNLQPAPLPNRVAGGTATPRSSDTRTSPQTPSTNFPYTVATINPRTPIRSMPSDDGYATAFVGPQTELQVWRHDPNGWLAIRPPDGSFSLIDAKHLKATNDPDVFLVSTDRAQTWVGTQIDEDHTPISQVRLKLNERVAVISSLIIEEQNGAQTWYQIEPPAGEFRWVHQDDLRAGGRAYPAPSATDIASRPQPPANAPMSGYMPPLTNPAAVSHSPNGVDLPALDLEPGIGLPANAQAANPGDTSQWRAAQQTTPLMGYAEPQPWQDSGANGFGAHPAAHAATQGSNTPNGSIVQPLDQEPAPGSSRPPTPGDAWDAAVNQLRQDPVANAVANASHQSIDHQTKVPPTMMGTSPTPTATPDPQWATMDWNQKLAWVQTRLNQDSALPSQQWNLLPLLEHCRALWYAAPTTPQQEAAAHLGKRIEELMQWQYSRGTANDLSARAQNPNDPWAGQRWASAGSLVGSGVASTPGSPQVGAGSSPPTNPAFDAVGYLKELVVARGQRSNEYVLQDNNGRSICHLSAQPGVNLNNFLDQKVGVIGIVGINGKLNLTHVSVERIYPVQ